MDERQIGVKNVRKLQSRFKKSLTFSSSDEKLNVMNKTDEMSSSDSEYDETGVSNPTFDDEITSNFATNSSDNTISKVNYLKQPRKSILGVEETSFTTSTSELSTKSSSGTVKAEKPYEFERIKPQKKPRRLPKTETSTTATTSESVLNISTNENSISSEKSKKPYEFERIKLQKNPRRLLKTESSTTTTSESLFNISAKEDSILSEKSKSTSDSKCKKSIKTLSGSSSLDQTENTESSSVITTTRSTGKLKKTKRKLPQLNDSSESIIKSTSSQLEKEIPLKQIEKRKKVQELSSGEVIFSSDEPKKRSKKIKEKNSLNNIPEENSEHESSEVTRKPKPRRKKRKEIISDSATTTTEEETPSDNEILAILIHRIDGFKMHYFISHPLVQVHLFDLNSGTYVAKLKNSKSITSYYEEESSPVNHIMPVMTQPYEMKGKYNMTPEWQELLIFNEKMSYFLQEDPNVLIFFEVLDFISMAQATKQYKKLGKDGGWHRVAWAFLKLVGANNALNVGRKVRLQLYYPLCNKNWSLPCMAKVSKNMFGWWNNNSKKKYPYTLYVTVKGIEVPHVQPGLRSMIPTQEEKGRTTVDDIQRALEGKSSSTSEERPTTSQSGLNSIRWHRLPNQLCKIPTKLFKKIHVGKSASCFVVKFSNSGRFLACGAMENSTTHSILIYEIPSGEYKSKCCSHFGIVYDLAWSSSDNQLLSSSADCTARLWQVEKGKYQHCKILPHPSYVYSAKFHPRTPRVIVTACYDHVVRVWDSTKEECELMQELSQHVKFVNAVCFDNEGDVLLSGDGIGTVCLWNVYVTSQPNKPVLTRDWSLKQTIKPKELHCKIINDIILHPGGRRILITTRDNTLRLFDSRDFTLIQKYDGHQNMVDYMHSTITPCASLIFSGSEDGSIHVWNTNSGSNIHTYTIPSYANTVCSIHYHPHEHMFACCSYGENVPVLLYIHEEASTTSQNESEETETSDKSDQFKPKMGKMKIRLDEKTSSSSVISSSKTLSESSDRSRTVTFQDEVQPTASKWQKVLDKLNGIVESSSKTSTLSGETCIDTFTSQSSSSKSSTQFKVVSLYSYKAQNESELNLKPGDVISVGKEINSNWSEGILANGTRGIFPANYVYRIEGAETSTTADI